MERSAATAAIPLGIREEAGVASAVRVVMDLATFRLMEGTVAVVAGGGALVLAAALEMVGEQSNHPIIVSLALTAAAPPETTITPRDSTHHVRAEEAEEGGGLFWSAEMAVKGATVVAEEAVLAEEETAEMAVSAVAAPRAGPGFSEAREVVRVGSAAAA